MALVLVVEDEEDLRNLVMDILIDAGYDVIEAENGGTALEKARNGHPDMILLDVMMPVMDGFEVLTKLRQIPATQATPVIMLTAFPPAKGELRAWKLGARHYIRKPFDPEQVELAVSVALREMESPIGDEVARDAHRAHPQASTFEVPIENPEAPIERPEVPFEKPEVPIENPEGPIERPEVPFEKPEVPIRTGYSALDQKLGNGIPHGSLALIDGSSAAGKSVLSQHLTYGSLVDGRAVAYITSENTVASLSNKMRSIGCDPSEYLRAGTFQVYPLDATAPDPHPEFSMEYLAEGIERLPIQCEVIVVDSITDIAADAEDRAVMNFFSRCTRLCSNGRTVILAVHSEIFDEKLLARVRARCDAHFHLTVKNVGIKLVKVLEVRKLHGAELNTDNVLNFEVVPEIGIRELMTHTITV